MISYLFKFSQMEQWARRVVLTSTIRFRNTNLLNDVLQRMEGTQCRPLEGRVRNQRNREKRHGHLEDYV